MPTIEHRPADPAVHALAIRLARQCRHVIQAVLREEEARQRQPRVLPRHPPRPGGVPGRGTPSHERPTHEQPRHPGAGGGTEGGPPAGRHGP